MAPYGDGEEGSKDGEEVEKMEEKAKRGERM